MAAKTVFFCACGDHFHTVIDMQVHVSWFPKDEKCKAQGFLDEDTAQALVDSRYMPVSEYIRLFKNEGEDK